MKTMLKGLLIVLVVAAIPVMASAQQWFDFTGQALVPANMGDVLTVYGEVFDGSPATTTPIPLDFANYQYTLVIDNVVLVSGGMVKTYAGGTVTIYQDASTLADYGNPATFTDGVAILVGNFVSLTQFVPPSVPGSANGFVDWVGGTRINDMASGDQLGWSFHSATNPNSGLLVPGYDEVWDGKVEPPEPIVPTQAESMSGVKALFR